MKKNVSKILILLVLAACTNNNLIDTVAEDNNLNVVEVIKTKSLEVNSFENLPNALTRIVVTSTKVELDDNLQLTTYEYSGTGSGFFISSDGYIVTNNHVISGSVTIDVYTQYRSQPYRAKLIGLSECDDIAVLKIDIEDVNYLKYSSETPVLGQEIIAAGFPRGDEEVTFLDGIVSKKETDGSTSWASIDYAFEHTAEILPGSSGGPIVNQNVEVIGIAYAGNDDRQEFGIPINSVAKTINDIVEDNFKYTFKANIEQFYDVGLYVYSIESDSPLRKVGFEGGEIITHIKGLSISQEETLKVYCDAINSRDISSGIKLKGVNLSNFEEFNVEVSLDGSITSNLIASSYEDNSQNLTTTTTASNINSTTTTTKYIIPDHNTYIESVLMNLNGEELSVELIFYSERPVLRVGTLSIGCYENEDALACINNTKNIQQLFDSHHPEASSGNGRISACNDYHGLNSEVSLSPLGSNRYKYICKKYEFNHRDFILSQIDIDIDNGSWVRYNLSELAAWSYGWKSDERSCFNNTKGWTVFADGVPQSYTQSLGYPSDEDSNVNEKSCVDLNISINFNGKDYGDGEILYIDN